MSIKPRSEPGVRILLDVPTVVFYHDPCSDGFTAAWLVRKWFMAHGFTDLCKGFDTLWDGKTQLTFSGVNYDGTVPEVPDGWQIIIVDFSWGRDVLLAWLERMKNLVVIDHHKTAKDALSGCRDFAVFDMEECGASLTNRLLFEHSTPLIEYIRDRDLWLKELPDTEEIAAAIQSYPRHWENWDMLNQSLDCPDGRDRLVAEGRGIRRHIYKQAAESNYNVSLYEIGGYQMWLAPEDRYISEAAELLYNKMGDAIVGNWRIDRDTNQLIVSLRTHADNDIDVSAVARDLFDRGIAISGGGHAKAAGFRLGMTRGTPLDAYQI